jgi:hypothetical protein
MGKQALLGRNWYKNREVCWYPITQLSSDGHQSREPLPCDHTEVWTSVHPSRHCWLGQRLRGKVKGMESKVESQAIVVSNELDMCAAAWRALKNTVSWGKVMPCM